MTQAQLKEQEETLKANELVSFVQLSQEGHKNVLVSSVKAEFVNMLKVRKVIQKSLL